MTLEEIEKEILAKSNNSGKFPDFSPGDTIRVNVKIIEGNKQRIQPYEGTVIAIKHGNHRKTFTVRRVSYGVAVERIFPYHSPVIDSIELVRKGKARRSKLYYLRGKYGRSAVLVEKV
ncbi:MAG: 50S ribosomal protein L19 [Brevinematia bacterium]